MPASLTAASVYGAMSDPVEAVDIDGHLYVAATNLSKALERARKIGAEIERAAIAAWLREEVEPEEMLSLIGALADEIEAGEHLERQKK